MLARRVAAVVVAVALVATAFIIRSGRDEPTNATATTDPDGSTNGDGDVDAVVCIPELRVVCDAVHETDPSRAVRTEPAATTLATLTAADADEPALIWVTVRPFPGMVDAQRATLGTPPLTMAESGAASTPLAVAVLDEPRLAALAATCGDVDIWACLGEYAGQPWTALGGESAWGTVRPAIGDVSQSATALVSFGAATSGYFGSTTFNRSAWEADTGFLGWLRPLTRTVSVSDLSGGTPVATMATRASAVNAAATTDAELAALGAGADRFGTEYPQSAMSLDAVIAAPDGVDGVEDVVAVASQALTGAGWEAPAGAANGPSASTTLALLELWEATT